MQFLILTMRWSLYYLLGDLNTNLVVYFTDWDILLKNRSETGAILI